MYDKAFAEWREHSSVQSCCPLWILFSSTVGGEGCSGFFLLPWKGQLAVSCPCFGVRRTGSSSAQLSRMLCAFSRDIPALQGRRKQLLRFITSKLCTYPELCRDGFSRTFPSSSLVYQSIYYYLNQSSLQSWKNYKHTQKYKQLFVWLFNHQTLKCSLCNPLGNTHLPKCYCKMSLQGPHTK